MSSNLVPMENEINVYTSIAAKAFKSKFYRNYGDEAAVMTIMLSAREIGIPPMAALNGGLNIIKGKIEISARLMNAMIRRAGHSIKTVESTGVICSLIGKRNDNGDTETVSFSLDDARCAGLIRPDGGWNKYPIDMLYARALSRLARRLFPDVIGCAYVEGEIGEAKVEIIEDAVIEEPIAEDSKEELNEFISSLEDKDEAVFISEYIKKVHDKYEIPYKEIIEKYHKNVDAFISNFNVWKEKNKPNETS